MRKKGSYRKNKLFCLLAAAALRFVQSYLNDIAFRGIISKTDMAGNLWVPGHVSFSQDFGRGRSKIFPHLVKTIFLLYHEKPIWNMI